MAAHWVKDHFGKDAVMLVLPADHLIEKNKIFTEDVILAAKQAQKQGIITFGIPPNYPETGYGYICTSEKEVSKKIQKIARFVEKPDLKTAQKYVKSKKYFWNSGVFCFSVESIISAFQAFQPKMWQNSLLCAKKSQKKINNQKINQKQTNFKTNFLLEPVSKNTAPAVLMAAHWVKDHFGKDAVMLVLPADHLIEKKQNIYRRCDFGS